MRGGFNRVFLTKRGRQHKGVAWHLLRRKNFQEKIKPLLNHIKGNIKHQYPLEFLTNGINKLRWIIVK